MRGTSGRLKSISSLRRWPSAHSDSFVDLHHSDQAFAHRVVEAVADGARVPDEALGGESAAESERGVLRALVAVMDGAGRAHLAASPDRHVQCFERELDRLVGTNAPAEARRL
jgi:hypothetical protein